MYVTSGSHHKLRKKEKHIKQVKAQTQSGYRNSNGYTGYSQQTFSESSRRTTSHKKDRSSSSCNNNNNNNKVLREKTPMRDFLKLTEDCQTEVSSSSSKKQKNKKTKKKKKKDAKSD